MRTYGRIYNPNGTYQWIEVSTDANGNDDLVYFTTLCQVLKLEIGESPFYGNYGLRSRESIMQQVWPDYDVSVTQQTFAPYFALLTVSKMPGATSPTYNVTAVTHTGVTLSANVVAQ